MKVYRNELLMQNWLRIRLIGANGNLTAAGAKIRLTEDGRKLMWFEEVMILDSQSAHSYYSLAPTERHFGLGQRRIVNVQVEFYPSGKIVERNARANSTLVISELSPPSP